MGSKKIVKTALAIVLLLALLIPAIQVHAAEVKLNKVKATISVGESVSLKLTGTTQKVTWSSDNTKVATVTSGKVTAKEKGTATITAKAEGKKYQCVITVKKNSLKLGKSTVNLDGVFYSDISVSTNAKKLSVSSSDEKVVSAELLQYSEKEIFVRIWRTGKGKATVTVKAGDIKKKISVTVTRQEGSFGYEDFLMEEQDGYKNFVDWSVDEYQKSASTYYVSWKKGEQKLDAVWNRGVKFGSSRKKVQQTAYSDAWEQVSDFDKDHAGLWTTHYIHPKSGLHFYKIFIFDQPLGLPEGTKLTEWKVTEIRWRCYAPKTEITLY